MVQMACQEPDFQLLPLLEILIDRHKLAGHVVTMERGTLEPQPDYSEVVVMIELHEISLKQLIDFPSDVETSTSVVRAGTLHVRKDPKNEALLDSTVGICSPKIARPALAAQATLSSAAVVAHYPAAGPCPPEFRHSPTLRSPPKILRKFLHKGYCFS